MDLATIIGLLLAWGALGLGIIIEGGELGSFFKISAVILVIGGTLGATVISFSLGQILSLPKIMMRAFLQKQLHVTEAMNLLIAFAEKARREGLLSLEDELEKVADPFLAKGVRLVVDGTDPALVRDILETELSFLEERHKLGESIFTTMGGFAPTLGIIGTVAGLVHMLSQLDDPSKMGPAIAAAFMATFYGVSVANLVFLPIANKLKVRSAEEVLLRQVIIEGVLSIQAGDNPRILEEKLRSFLPPAMRAAVGRHAKGEAGGAPQAAGAETLERTGTR